MNLPSAPPIPPHPPDLNQSSHTSLLPSQIPVTREVLASLPNVLGAMCLNARGLQSFLDAKPFDHLFGVLISPQYLSAMRRKKGTDQLGEEGRGRREEKEGGKGGGRKRKGGGEEKVEGERGRREESRGRKGEEGRESRGERGRREEKGMEERRERGRTFFWNSGQDEEG